MRLSSFSLLLLFLLCATQVRALTPAGSVIKNQASATYKDDSGVTYTVTSNVVETLIQQVAGVLLTQNQGKSGIAGQSITFAHTLTNTGNGPDAFDLSASNLAGDNFNLQNFAVYADLDQNGVADNATNLTQTPSLPAGSSFYFVVGAGIPSGTNSTLIGQFSVTAASQFSAAVTEQNTDTVTVTSLALVEVTKTLSALAGPSPGGPVTVTLSYKNNSLLAASNVTLIDALPAGMSYINGSGRWSETGTTVLTDANANDSQGASGNTLRYCAYDTTCGGLPEASTDVDSISTNQLTAILASVPAGSAGSITFEISIDPGLTVQTLVNTAEFEYNDGSNVVTRVLTNSGSYQVAASAGVVANGSPSSATDGSAEPVTIGSAAQGATVNFDNYIWNTGNAVDAFDISIDTAASTFPAGTVFQLLQSDGQTPLVDSNGNALPDTGPQQPGTVYRLVLRAILPAAAPGNNGGAGYAITKSARSTNDPAKSSSVTDQLNTIVAATVDLTNDAVAGDAASLGNGPGPETTAQKQVSVASGRAARFTLFVNNLSTAADSYTLTASTDPAFATLTLPTDWNIVFYAADGSTVISGTELIAAGASQQVFADVSVPASQGDLTQSLYFRVVSPTTGATDIKHDAVEVTALVDVQLEPDSQGQVDAGGTVVYTHLLTSSGAETVNNIALSLNDSLVTAGWTSVLYADTNGDGLLDGADQIISSVPTLANGVTITLFAKVFAPADAPLGANNVTTLQASWNGGTNTLVVNDITTVNQGDISIVKQQAPDFNCDLVADAAWTTGTFEVEPGLHCVLYRLTATNTGTSTMFNAVIRDGTPSFTVYQPSASCSVSGCVVTEPAALGTGIVSGEIATILPGQKVELEFAVRVE